MAEVAASSADFLAASANFPASVTAALLFASDAADAAFAASAAASDAVAAAWEAIAA
ncbi:hypothetical protein LTZ17_12170 [Lacticaseibacillus casei]|uniref:hypothetical protein n=1 Tax=Lacticaseibacillus TaxID=2759736 RepID=UPI001484E6A1|nr:MULTISPECIES: hypothetical protein [Lacticaseibacillus]MDE3283415.1 hypothetical protein [Lacticaseibacillus casei]QVI31570.1 hypothetical protein KG087_11730 [Lacticaseibacillus zeae]